MKKILPILAALAAAFIFFFIGRGVGDWYSGVLKDSGGMVTATEMISCTVVIPIVFAVCAAYIAYYLTADE